MLQIAGVPGLEPRMAEPESAELPITPYPRGCLPLRSRVAGDKAHQFGIVVSGAIHVEGSDAQGNISVMGALSPAHRMISPGS